MRLGAVSYLNTKPLVFGLAELAPDLEIVLDYPSRLADGLAAGSYDVALVPSIEFFRGEGYTIVSDACIACRGPVWSVKLASRVPIDRISSLALDEGSRTSAALVRILLAKRFGARPKLVSLPLAADPTESSADAVLVIGDRAMHGPPAGFAETWDLGGEWCAWTGLPFVFAMWVARGTAQLAGLAECLAAARDCGIAHLAEIAAAEAPALGLSKSDCLRYLRDNLHFRLETRERAGLRLFYRLAQEMELAPAGIEFGCEVAQSV